MLFKEKLCQSVVSQHPLFLLEQDHPQILAIQLEATFPSLFELSVAL